MNINQEMQSLGHIGGESYAPSEQFIDELLGRTRRARAVRQGAVSVVSAVSAIAIGAVAVQAINATKDDPAFRDRNLINDRSELTSIEKYKAKYGGIPVNTLESPVDVTKIIEDLKAAAQAEADLKTLQEQQQQTDGAKDSKTGTSTKPTGEPCVAKDHPDKPYKTWDCAKGEWVVKAGWFWNDYSDTFEQCSTQTPYGDKYFDCNKGKWVAKAGYFEFGGSIYPTITWTDSATGQTASGNYIPSYDKVAFVSGTNVTDYKHLEGNASWSGSTCNGTTATIKNAPFKYSCLTDGRISHNNGSGGKVAKQWILQDSNYKWHSIDKVYYCIDTPPAGWTWDGTQWVATP